MDEDNRHEQVKERNGYVAVRQLTHAQAGHRADARSQYGGEPKQPLNSEAQRHGANSASSGPRWGKTSLGSPSRGR